MEETPTNRQTGPRPNFAHNTQVEGIVEEASDDNEVQYTDNHPNDPVTPGMQPEIPISSILPPGETPISWYVRSQGAINAVYAQLCAQTAPPTQSRRPVSRTRAPSVPHVSHHDAPSRVQVEDTEGYSRSPARYEHTHSENRRRKYHDESHSHRRQSVHSRLGPRRNTHTSEYGRTYQEGDSTSVFNRLQLNYKSCKPHAVYNPEAEHDYNLIYRPAEAAENSKFISEIALAPLEKAKLPSNVGKFNGMTDPDDHLRVFTSAGLVGGWTLPMWCHLFIQTLTGAARLWFDNLPVRKITSWVDLREKFLVHFSQQRRSIRDTAGVMNIWRRADKSLEDFVTRYNKEMLEIGDVHEHLIRAQFNYAVRYDNMIKVLSGTEGLPKSWEKLMAAAKVYAQTEKNLSSNRPPPPHSRPTDMSTSSGKKFKKNWRDSNSGNYSSEDTRATINKLAA
ncbi:uncharacterized protein LOC118487153 [Helianthus annuus]|uniref:uncharacterized protein LOC118487153 n=1 Tax=Helianthus annuus TaxID=4232 RepID=UPI0016531F38|nr:uncharacterized protein LOC118487153 [Helianthus annuus]XP_035839598.1 uncharacterized protein LOC118487153 [Helianthus annuus]XP_035839599.1 uncharacterized protein LOC118487153 [Helianthus annuus]